MNVAHCISVIIMLVSTWLGLDLIRSTSGVRWLAISRSASLSNIVTTDICDRLRGLRKRQKKVCRKHVGLMDSVRLGAGLAIDECQHQFRHRRWNCSTINSVNIFGNVMKRGYREAAFTHAISSAAVAYAVTRSCSSGQLHMCGCDRSIKGRSPKGFEWAGCSDNIAYGVAFSRDFVDSADRKRRKLNSKKASRPLMNLHNNEAGRRSVESEMRVQCKCHGVSGSCEMKTCWNALPKFRVVGDILKRKFDEATEVKLHQQPLRWLLRPLNVQFKPHTKEDLVYLEASPDFCDHDRETGSLGTTHRRCNSTSLAIDGCDLMCCGRGHHSRAKTVSERCNCKFFWCCHVKCEECKRDVTEHRCH